MTGGLRHILADDGARRTAIAALDRSLIVEAGAGSGKTAVMAGRVAMMLASGTAPRAVAAVTFTELAASELLLRVRHVVDRLLDGDVPPEMRVALPEGLSPRQATTLAAASASIDEIACSTIHGFCQRLIKPYPVEADIDPGAGVMDRNQAALAFLEITDDWLRKRLSAAEGGLIAEMVIHDPGPALALVRTVLGALLKRQTIAQHPLAALPPLIEAFQAAAATLKTFLEEVAAKEADTTAFATRFTDLSGALTFGLTAADPASLVRLLTCRPHPDLCTGEGAFLVYRKKGKWQDAAKRAGLSKADGDRLNLQASGHFEACCAAWRALLENVASRVLHDLIGELTPVIDRFRAYKRSAALLDFDDLIHAARDLLRDHDVVRCALAARHAHVLVDEFQDTDPLQAEIFWRLCGDPAPGGASSDWAAFRIRPGALFLVGDPKQAVYRFRGADVGAYVKARDAFVNRSADSILPISTNFRSCASILGYVNARFAAPLSAEGQPGFAPLDAFHPDRAEGLCVAALDVEVADAEGKASAEQRRDGEAEAVAAMCERLIGNDLVRDHASGANRICRPGDIALLAPTGSDLWRYEEALERRGIPVATQAGKGLFRRQEVQDLIALTRVLSDRRDTLALGALLRGPLVGLTEEELLDIVWALPRSEAAVDLLPRLDLDVALNDVLHPLARDVLGRLQALRRLANRTTPYDLLSQAVDALRVRPTIQRRHGGRAERALANVDLFLGLSRSYAVRGLAAFSTAMTAAWQDEERAVEGRPDAQEEAVVLYTMHAAKGLEWAIIVPINTMTKIKATEAAVTDVATGRFLCPVFGAHPVGYADARDAETRERNRERIRLWYVAATRARDILVLPRLDVAGHDSSWIGLLDLALDKLPALDVSRLPETKGDGGADVANRQSRASFAAEAAGISERKRELRWLAPSRDEAEGGAISRVETPELMRPDLDGNEPSDGGGPPSVQGGRDRGLVIHKLIEEVLTGETADDVQQLSERAATLLAMLGYDGAVDPLTGPAASEIVACIVRTLALPEIAALRGDLIPEFAVHASSVSNGVEHVTTGMADALTLSAAGEPVVIVDWKSDVAPTPETIEHYRAQVRSYIEVTAASRGLIVFVTTGIVLHV